MLVNCTNCVVDVVDEKLHTFQAYWQVRLKSGFGRWIPSIKLNPLLCNQGLFLCFPKTQALTAHRVRGGSKNYGGKWMKKQNFFPSNLPLKPAFIIERLVFGNVSLIKTVTCDVFKKKSIYLVQNRLNDDYQFKQHK